MTTLWPSGRPALGVYVEAENAIERGDKLRAARLRILRAVTPAEWDETLGAFAAPFAPHAERIVEEQRLWMEALGRPQRDEAAVLDGLRTALAARGLQWELRRYGAAWAAWDARDAWDAWDAGAAMIVCCADLMGWTRQGPDLLSAGLRDAYRHGLGIALPIGVDTLGWAMERGRRQDE